MGAGCLGVLLFFFVFWCCVCVYVFVSFALSGGFVFLWWVFWGCCWWGVVCLGSVLGVFWVFGGGFRLFLGLFFGIMVLGGFLGIWPCVESSLFPCQCVMHWGAFSSFLGSIINL